MNTNNTILVVDDDPDLLFSTVQILKSAGYEVIEASMGKEGLDKTREHQPDLVLLDILLPDIDGREVCKQIKANSSLASIYVILISGIEISSESQADGLEVGADEYIARPVSERELLARIQTMLRLKQTEEVLRKAHDELEIRVEERTVELKRANEQLQQEIEERKRAEEAMRESEERFRQLAENNQDAFWVGTPGTGDQRRILYVNPAFEKIFGIKPEEMYQSDRAWLEILHEEDRDRVLSTLEEFLQGKKEYNLEYRIIHPDGSMRWIWAKGSKVKNDQGEVYRTIGLAQDITRRKQTEEELRRLKDQLHEENIYLREEIRMVHNFGEIIGQSEALSYTLFRAKQVAATDTTVLILGETGTGKELVARAIHQESLRNDRPLVKVNCAALPSQLIESELFGHEKGAFTGATAQRLGRFELADGATIFLDEIGELPLELQAKLLRVLQDGEFERLGSSRTIRVDVRVIAATNRNLEAEVQSGRFREDLFYRLNIYPLSITPLRERSEDIPLLAQAFVKRFSKKVGKSIERIPRSTMQALQRYTWPGNIRELQNVIERAIITAPDNTLRVELAETSKPIHNTETSLEGVEREHIQHILNVKDWKIEGPQGAAATLGLHPSTLRFRMKKLGIKRP